jgi:pyruvate dehydrogenase E1 component alpha subunit
MPRSPAPVTAELLLDLYRRMLLVRRAEERLATLFANSEVPGFIHLSIGQEATAVGVIAALAKEDTLASNHRGHGHALAKGIPLGPFFLEIMGKDGGICGGRGGSMHVADMSAGMLGANGIVGAGLSLALGSALAFQTRGERRIASVFFGDGAVAEGLLHECLNLAALWRLPLLLVCENNGWAEFTPSSGQIAASLGALAQAFRIPYHAADGNDVEAVHGEALKIVAAMRDEPGPHILECHTRRVRGHYEGDPQKYRIGEALLAEESDPLSRCRRRLFALGAEEEQVSALDGRIAAEIEAAVAMARAAAEPSFETARMGVYTLGAAPGHG